MYMIRRCTSAREYWRGDESCNYFWDGSGWVRDPSGAIEFKRPWQAADYAAACGLTQYAVCGPM